VLKPVPGDALGRTHDLGRTAGVHAELSRAVLPGNRPELRRDPERPQTRGDALAEHGEPLPVVATRLPVAGDEIEHQGAVVIGGESATRRPDHRREPVRPRRLLGCREACSQRVEAAECGRGPGAVHTQPPRDVGVGEGGE
jgi:hypothetical protein